jgi:hypothetical protein
MIAQLFFVLLLAFHHRLKPASKMFLHWRRSADLTWQHACGFQYIRLSVRRLIFEPFYQLQQHRRLWVRLILHRGFLLLEFLLAQE